MVFDESPEKMDQDPSLAAAAEEDSDDYEAEDYGEIDQLHKAHNRYSLEVRRAIEDHLEHTRLQKEFDYLFDDEFVNDEDDEAP